MSDYNGKSHPIRQKLEIHSARSKGAPFTAIQRIKPIIEPKYGGVILDMDGTTVDSKDAFLITLQETCRFYGLSIPSIHKIRMNYDADNEFKGVFLRLKVPESLLIKTAYSKICPAHDKWLELAAEYEKRNPPRLINGTLDLLKTLIDAKITIFIVSGAENSRVLKRMKHFRLDRFIHPENIFGGRSDKSKVISEIREKILPEKTMSIGDIPCDLHHSILGKTDVTLIGSQYSYAHPLKLWYEIKKVNKNNHCQNGQRAFYISSLLDVIPLLDNKQ